MVLYYRHLFIMFYFALKYDLILKERIFFDIHNNKTTSAYD